MKRSLDKKTVQFYLWLTLVFLLLEIWHDNSNFDASLFQILVDNFWRVIYVLIVNFLFLEQVIPFVLRKRNAIILNILLGIPVLFFFMIIWSFGLYAWRNLGVRLHIYTPLGLPSGPQELIASQMGFSVASIACFGIGRHVFNYVKLKTRAQQLSIEKQQAELNYLKSQTNPHFLFNTLNNIYSLAREKSDLAPESILRLSKILRFMLYETSGAYIAIEQEIKIINDYIALEKLRYDESLLASFSHDIEDMRQALPPLLLIPLVENAFKHGVSETRGRPFVEIHLSVRQRRLQLLIKNSSERAQDPVAPRENIGLSNLRRQLEMLFKEFELTVQQGDAVFTATLKINLASHV